MSVLPYNCIRCDKYMLYREPQLCEVCRNIKLWLANELVKATFAHKAKKEIMSVGIDYGMGKTNIDPETCIRYGVISQHSVTQAWSDSSEPVYGDPTCPKCAAVVSAEFPEDAEAPSDLYCMYCNESWRSDECFPEEPRGFEYREEGYVLVSCMDSEIMVIKSPFYTLAQFCSPCVPGAGNLNNWDDYGVKTYCLGHDWFEGNKAPYPVYSVSTDNVIGD